jgi:hypothetical protein
MRLSNTRNRALRRAATSLREAMRTAAYLPLLPWGLLSYAWTGETSARAYKALIWTYCVSGGRSNAALSWAISRMRPAKPIPNAAGVLGDLSQGKAREYVERLRRDGYVLFERALPDDLCQRLVDFACSTPSSARRMDDAGHEAPAARTLFAGHSPAAVRYDYDIAALLDNGDVQHLLADRSLLRLAQAYLECQPFADVISMWWHTNYRRAPDSEAAQFYHFDLDRIKWFKVFIYLTDVGPMNGPHSFVVGSHRTDGIPWTLRRKGYARLQDHEVLREYPADRCIHFTAPRGSILIEDTRGLHKGNVVQAESRLILQLQFSNSLFGAYYAPARISKVESSAFREQLHERPEIYQQYL